MARHIYILVLLLVAMTFAPVSTAKSRYKPRKSEGNYTLKVAGFFYGQGNAEVKPGQEVKLSLYLTPEAGGRSGAVTANLTLTGNRFVGNGLFIGKPMHFEGRLDVPDDDKERNLRGVRLVCRMRSGDSKYSSVIGFVPDYVDDDDKK